MNKVLILIKECTPWALIANFIMLLFLYAICRVAFVLENMNALSNGMTIDSICNIFGGGVVFDISAICYTNAFYVLAVLFPIITKEKPAYRRFVKSLFLIVNTISLSCILTDSVYYKFTQHHATAIIFNEFSSENNLHVIFAQELISHWYLVLLAFFMLIIMSFCYREYKANTDVQFHYYLNQVFWLCTFAFLIVSGIRGSFPKASTRPISLNDAYLYTNNSTEASFIVNTPFAIIRTLSEKPLETPNYFADSIELEKFYSPIHYYSDTLSERKKNVVFLILESFGQEYVGVLNKRLDGGEYKGYTTFIDSLLQHSLTWEHTFSNSGFSIDAMPALLASIPRMDRPFVVSPYSLNNVYGLGSLLGNWGYSSAFFHGAIRASLGLQAFATSVGFQQGFSKEDYCEDDRFGGEEDFDGTWAIWDEPFLQYTCLKMSEMKEPFLTAVFTASSHHPFAIPEKYKNIFVDEGEYAMHKCVRYTDNSLREFFKLASEQSWYNNTIFVVSADHSLKQFTHDEYKTELGAFKIPIFIFEPSGELPKGISTGIAQQIDMMPTLLHYLGYPYPFFAFGKDLLDNESQKNWAMNWDHFPQFIQGNYVLQFDGHQSTAIYDYIQDPLLKTNLIGRISVETEMTDKLKAFIQTYFDRMKADDLVY